MKQYEVTVHITMVTTVSVEAENEEQAEIRARNYVGDDPYYYVKNEDDAHCEDIEVADVCEGETPEDSEDPVVREALDYVREQLEEDELLVYKATVSKNLNRRMPAAEGLDDGRIIDLLEEYGADNDLSEGWWEEFGDIDDILLKL